VSCLLITPAINNSLVFLGIIISMEKSISKPGKEYTTAEEIAHSITHGLGAILSVAGLVVLLVYSALFGNARHLISSAVYGSSLIILYLSSTLYHAFQGPKIKHIFQILDHSSIFFLIAGTYTPFTLVTLHGRWGWILFGLVWGMCVLGVIFKVFLTGRFAFLSGVIYVAMGWLVVIVLKPLTTALHPTGFKLLLSGGLLYTLGLLFYGIKRIPWNHLIWHLFVFAASILQYFAVLFYVLPLKE